MNNTNYDLCNCITRIQRLRRYANLKNGVRIPEYKIICENDNLNSIHELDRLEHLTYNIFKFADLLREDFYGQGILAVNVELISYKMIIHKTN